jgi:hypothetical protein
MFNYERIVLFVFCCIIDIYVFGSFFDNVL